MMNVQSVCAHVQLLVIPCLQGCILNTQGNMFIDPRIWTCLLLVGFVHTLTSITIFISTTCVTILLHVLYTLKFSPIITESMHSSK